MGHEHEWRLKAKTFAEPDPEMAAKLQDYAVAPPIFYKPEYFRGTQLAGAWARRGELVPVKNLPEDMSIESALYAPTPFDQYERAKQGVTTFVWTCVCGELRKEECIGREPANEQ